MRVLMTGATGFIGSHAVEHFLKETDWELVLLEGLNYASSMQRLVDMDVWPSECRRVTPLFHNIQAALSDDVKHRIGTVDAIVHFAAETHVDKALVDPRPFVLTNVVGTLNVLEFAREVGVGTFVQISTDEVYGPAPDGVFFKEGDPHKPSNPYSASKAGADCLAYSYYKSFGVPVIITRTTNNFGQRQHVEKFIPKTIRHIVHDEPVLIHGTGPENTASRCWIHARNHADAVKFLLEKGVPGEIYHAIADDEYTCWQIYQEIAVILKTRGIDNGKVDFLDFHSARPGHDRRYALSGEKLRLLGWTPSVPFRKSLEQTVLWSLDHKEWLGL